LSDCLANQALIGGKIVGIQTQLRISLVHARDGRSLSPAAESLIEFLFGFVEQHAWSAAESCCQA